MESKLELKHLAAYLPYGLKVQYFDAERGEIKVCTIELIHLPDEITIIDGMNEYDVAFDDIKPLLIPLSELTKEQWFLIIKAGFDNIVLMEPKKLGNWDIEYHANAVEIVFGGFSASYDFRNFQFNSDIFLFNQLAAFNKMYGLHADFNHLIAEGLALNTLTHGN